jgi:hypothetical protein
MKIFFVSCLKATGIDSFIDQMPCAPDRHSDASGIGIPEADLSLSIGIS